MNSFSLARPKSYTEAATMLREKRWSLPVLKAGGMDLVDHLKEGLMEPDLLIDVKRLRAEGQNADIMTGSGGYHVIGAGATLAAIAASPLVNEHAPVIAQACGDAATPQVRNVATAAGNLLQRPRCWYYRHAQFNCLKKGGDTCYALNGENKFHAIFGGGPCHIVHPSNLAMAMMVATGRISLTGGERTALKVEELFHLPDRGIRTEHVLEPYEVITALTFRAAKRSAFYTIKEKQSFDWPMVAAAVALEMSGDTIQSAKVCAGAVAPIPWMLPRVGEALAGVNVKDEAALKKACDLSADGAKPMSQNAYKVRLLPVAVRRAVLKAAGLMKEAS